MKKTAVPNSGSRKTRPSAGQARPSAGQVKTKETDAPAEPLTFKGGLRYINIKYAHTHSAYIPFHKNCENALAPVAGAWLAARTRSKRATLCLAGSTIRFIRHVLEYRIRDEMLLYVMNAYIYGVINTASPTDALQVTRDYEQYIANNTALTALQRDTLLKGFAVAKNSFQYWA